MVIFVREESSYTRAPLYTSVMVLPNFRKVAAIISAVDNQLYSAHLDVRAFVARLVRTLPSECVTL
jgi:hypothetical protein